MESRIRELVFLPLGDLLFLFTSLWLTLLVRDLQIPSTVAIESHLAPFGILIGVWLFVFYVSGLYDKHTTFLKSRLFGLILNVQIFNILIGALFFFTVPGIGITPKTNLLIYLVVSSALILLWRLYIFPLLLPRKKKRALLIAKGEESEELIKEINGNQRYDFEFVRMIDDTLLTTTLHVEQKILDIIQSENITIIIADTHSSEISKFLPTLFDLIFFDGKIMFLDFHRVYEDIFDRIPISYLEYQWFLENIPRTSRVVYDVFKRGIDIVGAFTLMVVLLPLLPLVALAIKYEDGGNVFIKQTRIGRLGSKVVVFKFRTMRENDGGVWLSESTNTVTKVGSFLRKTSIDELPQLINIFFGEMSLIGPRNDIVDLGNRLTEAIPYYDIRYFITPGITGWAQTHQMYTPGNISPQSIEESRLRLAYDLYYIKHRSLLLDVSIALRTLKTLLSRFGLNIRVR